VILTDVMMPQMSGAQVVQAVRAVSDRDGVPIILVAAKADDELRTQLLRTGAQDYLVEPFSPEELRACGQSRGDETPARHVAAGAGQSHAEAGGPRARGHADRRGAAPPSLVVALATTVNCTPWHSGVAHDWHVTRGRESRVLRSRRHGIGEDVRTHVHAQIRKRLDHELCEYDGVQSRDHTLSTAALNLERRRDTFGTVCASQH
jgi:CheY-like chemotaxis protein